MLRDNTFALWDCNERYRFEKIINIKNSYKVFYVEFYQVWLTICSDHIIHKWDILEEEAVTFPVRNTKEVTAMREMPQFQMIAVCSLDRQIILWDVINGVPKQIIKNEIMSFDKICYSADFNIIFTGNYEKFVNVYTCEFEDFFVIAKLEGHKTQISAMEVLEGCPMLITIDVMNFIKTWDIRDLNCRQTLHFDCKGQVQYVFNLGPDRILFTTALRFLWFKYDQEQ